MGEIIKFDNLEAMLEAHRRVPTPEEVEIEARVAPVLDKIFADNEMYLLEAHSGLDVIERPCFVMGSCYQIFTRRMQRTPNNFIHVSSQDRCIPKAFPSSRRTSSLRSSVGLQSDKLSSPTATSRTCT